jgi:hypothetical protein
VASIAASCLLVACQNPDWAGEFALRNGAPRPDAAQLREAQTTRLPTPDELLVLSEATQALQDLGYTIEESAPRAGVLAGSKDRDATEAPQIAGQIALTIGLALLGVHHQPVWDTDQLIRVTLTTRPDPVGRETALRASFERIVMNNQGRARAEPLEDRAFHDDLYAKLRTGLATRGVTL